MLTIWVLLLSIKPRVLEIPFLFCPIMSMSLCEMIGRGTVRAKVTLMLGRVPIKWI